MAEKTDRRIRKTKAQLRVGLANLMKQKSIKEITVKELVDEVDINRSTFYLHYTDIYNMLESIENELFESIEQLIQNHPVSPLNKNSFSFIEDIFSILSDNREICCALLGPNGDIAFIHRIEDVISEYCLKALKEHYPELMDDLKYTYAFGLSGCVGLIKTWLMGEYEESPQHMAELTFRLLLNTMQGIHAVD